MKQIIFTANTPEENLALDEILLLRSEAGLLNETIRFWESQEYFVVLGRAGKVSDECMRALCVQDRVKIIRRISGGGTVLQGKGCLNYSLVLSYFDGESKNDIRSSYARVLSNITNAFKEEGIPLEVLPISDMALDGRKVSGNAQMRKRRYFLHHGTFLYDMDLAKIGEYLKHPPSEPEYREGRPHSDFVRNVPLDKEKIEEVLLRAFPASDTISLSKEASFEVKSLAESKYSQDEWNLQF